jgi:hypothetical protein
MVNTKPANSMLWYIHNSEPSIYAYMHANATLWLQYAFLYFFSLGWIMSSGRTCYTRQYNVLGRS